MKNEHDSRIAHLEKNIEELKGNLKGLVEINKEVMYNSLEGLKRLNEKIAVQKSYPINFDPSSVVKLSKKSVKTNT